jgi:hypothetical protein
MLMLLFETAYDQMPLCFLAVRNYAGLLCGPWFVLYCTRCTVLRIPLLEPLCFNGWLKRLLLLQRIFLGFAKRDC